MFVGPLTRSVDAWFARHFDRGPAPAQRKGPPRYGAARARYEWAQFGRAVAACAMSAALLGGLVLLADARHPAAGIAPLTGWFAILGIVLGVWFVVAASYTVFEKQAPPKS